MAVGYNVCLESLRPNYGSLKAKSLYWNSADGFLHYSKGLNKAFVVFFIIEALLLTQHIKKPAKRQTIAYLAEQLSFLDRSNSFCECFVSSP